jgi:hypothetical protein
MRRALCLIQRYSTPFVADGLRSQVTQYRFELWMHAVLAGAEIHRTDRQSFHDRFHLIQREAIGAGWIPVTKGA